MPVNRLNISPSALDWSLPDATLAQRHGVSRWTIRYHRRRLKAPEPAMRRRPTPKPTTLQKLVKAVDAGDMAAARRAVKQYREGRAKRGYE